MSPDDTCLIPVPCVLSSKSHPPGTLPIGLCGVPAGQGPQLFPREASSLPPRKVNLMNPPPTPRAPHLPPLEGERT